MPYDAPLGAHPRDHRHLPQGVAARGGSPTTGRSTRCPLPPEQGTGLGKPLKIITHPVRDHIPVYVASLGPKNVEMTAELADGWLPFFYLPERAKDVWGDARRPARPSARPTSARSRSRPAGSCAIGDGRDQGRARDFARPMTALYVGGMGAKGRNFYNDAACSATATKPRRPRSRTSTWPAKKDEAAAAVPDELLELTNLCGPPGYVKERIAAYREAGVTCSTSRRSGPTP